MNQDENNSDASGGPPRRRRVRRASLLPLNPVTLISTKGCEELVPSAVHIDKVGCKAFGLSCLPETWVPPFFVIGSDCLSDVPDDQLGQWIADSLGKTQVPPEQEVIVRSSGTKETLRDRGQLVSKSCTTGEIVPTLRELSSQVGDAKCDVRWIVQANVKTLFKGHLSNLRRLVWEPRDWVVEFEPSGTYRGFTTRLGVRLWRDGTSTSLDLDCTVGTGITSGLRRVAMWAVAFRERLLIEWVWDGERLFIVQTDREEPIHGVKPASLLPREIPIVKIEALRLFQSASSLQQERFGKLRNARVYGELGYTMPPFYVLDDPATIGRVLAGEIPPDLEGDLVELTKRPLVIRTDGSAIPAEKREMLPRTEEVRSSEEAKHWLLTRFRDEVARSELADAQLCLIAHHFIPSVACAWARAEPGNRMVRIESLWGLPEGLYWSSHDTFEIDTKDLMVAPGSPSSKFKYLLRQQRLRYKGTFIAPDSAGRWVNWQTASPHDWRRSIRRESWLFEIAHTTRQVAEREQQSIAVMWFVENHPGATPHAVLPWFHNPSPLIGSIKAAPRRKYQDTTDFRLRTVADWERLQQNSADGKRIERVVVEPTDAELIRNRPFAEALGKLAASKRFVVELAGGILSHAYYVLRREGAQVECVDLVGLDEDVVEYNKIVRDRIPEIIERRGERAETIQLRDEALRTALRRKLVEEAFEALDAKSDEDLVSELADIKEVVAALRRALGVTNVQLESERKEKKRRRGGFAKGLMLTTTAVPHFAPQPGAEIGSLGLDSQPVDPIIFDSANLPVGRLNRRPDLRHIGRQLEKLFTFEVEANNLETLKQTFSFSMPLADQVEQDFSLTVELRRVRSSIRAAIRLRVEPSQMKMLFPNDAQLVIEFPEDSSDG